ncbi:hypothetical protein EYF80_009366 [Liparis tanakae]|uniref:Uncharacterized protein n=1 Tax=Liparis tanakae TaxID=230148 RepID=A0A4Z2ISS9_9TELE|nr:hypothetical protein EYF80_009366 [Liparis tanakae]
MDVRTDASLLTVSTLKMGPANFQESRRKAPNLDQDKTEYRNRTRSDASNTRPMGPEELLLSSSQQQGPSMGRAIWPSAWPANGWSPSSLAHGVITGKIRKNQRAAAAATPQKEAAAGYLMSGLEPYMALPARLLPADRDRAAAERDSLPLISGSESRSPGVQHSSMSLRLYESRSGANKKSPASVDWHYKTLRKAARQQVELLPPEVPGGSQHLTFSSFLATDPRCRAVILREGGHLLSRCALQRLRDDEPAARGD